MASDLHRACARNEALEAQARDYGRQLSEAAHRELDRINAELRAIPPGQTLLEPALATRYNQLVADRAQILTHISG